MLSIGKVVVHKKHGICTITHYLQMSGQDYYQLIPRFDESMSIFVPVIKEQELLRDVLTKNEADDLISYMRNIDEDLIEDTKERRDDFHRRFSSGDLKDLAYICRKLFILKKAKEKTNSKFCLTDSTLFEKANKMLLDELSIAYNIDRSNIFDHVSRLIHEND
ncbi:MAG: hypothetical protein J1F31_03500 [Erysipelotrichales bacterium]|nr:hypothetical protein [Erysipelotrichales bacterium]